MTDTIVASDGEVIAKPLPGAGAANPTLRCAGAAALPVNENNRSVASLLRFGKVTIAQFGDLSWDVEHELACPVDQIGKVNLLLVTQHGSAKVSSNPAQLAAMRPDVAIMPNGGKKGGDPEVIAAVSALPGLKGFWRLHENYKHPELERRQEPDRQSQSAAGRDRCGGRPSLYEAPPDMGFMPSKPRSRRTARSP